MRHFKFNIKALSVIVRTIYLLANTKDKIWLDKKVAFLIIYSFPKVLNFFI